MLLPGASGKVADDLAVKAGQHLGFRTDAMPEVVESPILHPLVEKAIGFGGGGLFKRGKNLLLSGSGFCLKKDGALHSLNNTKNYLSANASLLPPVNGVGFRSEGF